MKTRSGEHYAKKTRMLDPKARLRAFECSPVKYNINTNSCNPFKEWIRLYPDNKISVVYLDGPSAGTTTVLFEHFPNDMHRVIPITCGEDYVQLSKVIKANKLVSRPMEGNFFRLLSDGSIDNDGLPLCINYDQCSMWNTRKDGPQNTFRLCLEKYCFGGAYFMINICLNHRQKKHVTTDPDVIWSKMNIIAAECGRKLQIRHQTEYYGGGRGTTKMVHFEMTVY
jgi:hypothetical protein